jgi:hypothetical protein
MPSIEHRRRSDTIMDFFIDFKRPPLAPIVMHGVEVVSVLLLMIMEMI